MKKTPSKSPNRTGHKILKENRQEQLKGVRIQIQKTREKIKDAKRIARRHEAGGKEDYLQKKLVVIQELEERLHDLIASERQLLQSLLYFRRRDPCLKQARNPMVQEHFYFAGRAELWKKAEENPSLFVELQRLHTPRHYRQLPKREGDFGKIDFHDLPLRQLIFDPTLIPLRYLEQLGLTRLPEGVDEIGQFDAIASCLPAYKQFCDRSLTPFHDFGRPGAHRNPRMMVVSDHLPHTDGWIIHSKGSVSKKRKEPQIFKSAYTFRRMAVHMEKGYDTERRKLDKAERIVATRQELLQAIRAEDVPEEKAKNRQKAHRRLRETPNIFKGVQVDKKKEAKETLHSVDLKDSRGQVNPGAAQARLVTVTDRIDERWEEDVQTIVKVKKRDFSQLEQVIHHCEAALSAHERYLGEYLKEGKAKAIPTRYRDLSDVKLRPFNLYAKQAQRALNAIEVTESGNTPRSVRPLIVRGYASLRLFDVEKEREAILLELAKKKGKVDLEYLLEQGRRLWRSAHSHQVRAASGPIRAIKDHLKDLADELKRLQKEGATAYQLRSLFKDGLKTINFETLLKEII
jgi:hypothetical protein